MRLRFLRMGGKEEIMGAYQGSYLFLQREGIFRSETLNGNRYVMLVRTGDGRLAMPGAMPTVTTPHGERRGPRSEAG